MKSRIKLNEGEKLKHEKHRSEGTLAETDIDTYSVVNLSGDVIGSVVHTDHTSIKGFARTQSVLQKDAVGTIIVDETW